jgi:hypothetical protein
LVFSSFEAYAPLIVFTRIASSTRDALIRAPGLAVPSRARDHALDAHQRRERARAEVRAGRGANAGVEQRPERHAALHQLLAVERELVGVVVRVVVNIAGTAPSAFMRCTRSSLISVQCVIFGRASARGASFCARSNAVRYMSMANVAVRVAVHLDAGAMHALDPRVELVLRLRDVALVRRDPGYGTLSAIVRSENDPSTVCSDVAPKLDPLVAEAGHDAASAIIDRARGRSPRS